MLGDELRKMRAARGLNPTTLARLSGISRTHLYAIERGENDHPYADTLIKLARGLASWRDDTPDEKEAAAIFRELQEAAGYPRDQIEPEDGETVATPVPRALAGPMLAILDSWARWGNSEREVAVRLLEAAAELGTRRPDTLEHSEPLDGVEQNQTDSSPKKQQQLLALYLDWLTMGRPRIGHSTDGHAHRVASCPGHRPLVGTR